MTPINPEADERLIERLREPYLEETSRRVGLKTEAADALTAANARIAELEATLKPFADAAENLDEDHRGSGDLWETSAAMSLTAGDIRLAAHTLANGGA